MTQEVERPELIEDREVQSATQDSLGHQAIAKELLDLISEVPTPTNIALYGPWGSGKTGIANLIQAGIKNDRRRFKDYKFARFDAFKFAETPLRRNFINAVATELEVTDAKYHSDLYTGVTSTKFSLPRVQRWALLRTFMVVFVGVCVVIGVVAALLALLQKGAWSDNFTKNSRSFFVAGFPFAAVLTAAFALATKAFGSEHKTERAESAEQFEDLFRTLVGDSGADRVIVFVDEIDRCTASEVVSTLDVIRTFLGVEKCIFIVAADQQVLETALSREARQETPDDTLNPYYSSGSAYLDKVFQHQIAVPPLPNQSVTRYAASLVEYRAGVWRSADRETIVSVLVPSHVRSPRRVKHLLNSYVVAYRVANERAAAGLLDTWNDGRAIELAKLVCLQVEFPIFARSMIEVPRLPEYVHAAAVSESWTADFPLIAPHERELAEQFATGKMAPDVVLSAASDRDSFQEQSPQDPSAENAHRLQLVDYLSRTASIRGPLRDLIYVQGLGTPFGLASDIADRILGASQNGLSSVVRNEIGDENADAVLDLIIEEVRSAIGVERRNVVAVVLDLLADSRLTLTGRADNIVTSIASTLNESADLITSSSIPGLWRLTGASSLVEASRLANVILASDVVHGDPALCIALFKDSKRITALAPETVDSLMREYLASNLAEDFIEQAFNLSEQDVSELVAHSPGLASGLDSVWTKAFAAQGRLNADAKALQDYEALASYARGAQPTPTAQTGDTSVAALPRQVTAALETWLDHLDNAGSRVGVQALIRVLLQVDRAEARQIVEPYLGSSGRWEAREDNDLLVTSASRRPIAQVMPWLDCIDASVATAESVINSLGAVGSNLWDDDIPATAVTEAGGRLAILLRECDETTRDQFEVKVLSTIDSVVSDNDKADRRTSALARSAFIVGSGAIAPNSILAVEARNLTAVLATNYEFQALGAPYVNYVIASLEKIFGSWGSPTAIALPETLYSAIQECTWLPEPLITQARLEAQALMSKVETEPLAEHVLATIDAHPEEAARLGALWFRVHEANGDPLEAAQVLDHLRVHNVWQSQAVREAIQKFAQRLTPADRLVLIDNVLADRFTLPTSILDAIGFKDLPDGDALELVITRMGTATRNRERKEVLTLANCRTYNSRNVRSRFVVELVVPLFSLGIEATISALEALNLFGRPFPGDTRSAVIAALKPAIGDDDRLMRKATEVLSPLGFATKGRGPLGIAGRQLKLK